MKNPFKRKTEKLNKQKKEKKPVRPGSLRDRLAKGLHYVIARPFLFCLIAAFVLNVAIEAFSRHSLTEAVLFIFTNPVAFLFGMFIIILTFLPTVFLKRRYAWMGFIFLLWLAMGVTNFVILFFRITPFSVMDIILVPSVVSIIDVYLDLWQVILISAAILLGIVGLIFMFMRLPKVKINYKKSLFQSIWIVVCFGLSFFTAIRSQSVKTKFPNLGDAYESYGFVYCFSASAFSRGISQPDGYSATAMKEIEQQINNVDLESILSAEKHVYGDVNNPNIIFVQLESFFDVNYLRGVKFSENPVPNFTRLKTLCDHGLLTVPSVGAGTANTEFEILTGMNKEYFGIGEYPYKTILQEETCESICYNLKDSGYTSHAIHNHYGTFYDRNTVFANLGFDTFTPLEHMADVPTTPEGWAKDEVLPEHINNAMKSTEGRDFIFAISVEAHGKYPTEPIKGYTPKIRVTDGIDDEAYRNQMEYYVNMVHETDVIISDIIRTYAQHEEPVMVVFYGDHLPNIELEQEDITHGDLLQTEYVIWTNYAVGDGDAVVDLTSYQLSAYVMQLCDKQGGMGILTKLHLAQINEPENDFDYQYFLEMLEYDMLYGNYYVYGENEPHVPTNMRLGVKDISITGIERLSDGNADDTSTLVKGDNFTSWSVVYVNDEEARTIYKNTHSLLIDDTELKKGDVIRVVQVAMNGTELSSSNEYIVGGAQ